MRLKLTAAECAALARCAGHLPDLATVRRDLEVGAREGGATLVIIRDDPETARMVKVLGALVRILTGPTS